MASEKKRKGRGKNITSALELLDREPYRTIIEIIHLFGEAAPWQIIYVSNNENEKELTQRERGKLQRLRRINKYKKEGNEVKQLIHSRPDNPPRYPLNSDNLKKFLNTLIQWGIVEKLERGRYQIAPFFKNEIIRKSNTRIIDFYAKDNISDFSESNLIVYGFEHLRKQLEEADRSEYAQKLSSEYPDIYLFSIDTKFKEDLNKGVFPQELKDKFKVDFMIEVREIEEWKEEKDYLLMHYSKWLPRILSLSDNATIMKFQDWCLLFCSDVKFEDDLNKNVFPEELKDKFKSYFKRMYNEERPFSDSATVTKGEGNEWQIDDERRQYIIWKEDDELKIYNSYAARMSIGKEWIIEDGKEFVARKEGNKLNIYLGLVLRRGKKLHTPIQDLRLFSIDAKFEGDFNKNIIPEELKNKFKSYFERRYHAERPFSDSAILTKREGNEWQIGDERRQYIIREEDGKLKIYDSYAALRRIGKDYIDIIKNRIKRIKCELEELNKEAREADDYISMSELDPEDGFLANMDSEKYREYLKEIEKKYDLPRHISLFYSDHLDFVLPSSVDVAIEASRWCKVSGDKTLSEEDREKEAKRLYQKDGREILKIVPNPIGFAYYLGEPLWKGKKIIKSLPVSPKGDS